MGDFLRKMRFSHDPLALMGLLIMLLSLTYIVYSFLPHSTSSPNILEDYVKAVHYLNRSSAALEGRLAGTKSMDFSINDAYYVRNRIQEYFHNLSLAYGSDNTFSVRVAKNYLYVADASTNSTAAYYIDVDGLREALQLLSLCKVDEALEKYDSVEENTSQALSNLAGAISVLSRVDKNSVAENHVPIIENSRERLEKVFNSLYNASMLMEIARRHREYIKMMCSRRPVNSSTLDGMFMLLSDLNRVRATGPLSPEIMSARNALESLIQSYLQQRRSCSGNTSGSGAGYAPPESDD
jgi:hypothetical protein